MSSYKISISFVIQRSDSDEGSRVHQVGVLAYVTEILPPFGRLNDIT